MAEGTEIGTAYVSIVPSAAGFGTALERQVTGQAGAAGDKAGKALSAGITGQVGGIAKGVAGLFAAIGAGRFLRGSLDEAQEAVKVGHLTNAVIKSTGGVANVTAGQVGDLATSLSKLAGVDDEVIQGAENVLLTFTSIRNQVGAGNDIFNQATRAALDLSTALGSDLQGSVIQLGKALNDPIQGMTALRRVGVSFTEQQQAQIKAMQQSGDLLGAQKIILAEINKEFGGAAAANATALDRMHVAILNLEESLGTALLPAINTAAGALTDMLGIFNAMPGPVRTVTAALVGFGVAGIALSLLAPRLRAAKLELEGMGAAGVTAGGALAVLGKVGLIGAVVGGVTLALGALGRQLTNLAKGPAASASNLTTALADLGENGAVTGELAKQFGSDLSGLNHELNQFTTPKIIQSLALLNPNLQDAKRDVKAVDQALADLVANGRPELAASAIDHLTGAISDEGGDPTQFTNHLTRYHEALGAVNLQARLTGEGVDGLGDAVAGASAKVTQATKDWDDLDGKLNDLVQSDWSKELASNLTSALNPLDKFTFKFGKDTADLKAQAADAQADLTKATNDLAKLTGTGTEAEIAKIRGHAGDIDAARAAVAKAAARLNATKAQLAEAQKSPLKTIGDNLQANLTGLTTWLSNLQKITAGGHEDLAKHLASLGPQAAGAVAEAVGVSPKQLDKIQGLFEQADTKIAEAASGAFELNLDQAGKPGETLADIIADRYQKTLTPKLASATLAALNEATSVLLGRGSVAGIAGGQPGQEPGPGEARPGQVPPPPIPPSKFLPTAPTRALAAPPPPPTAAGSFQTGLTINTVVNATTNADPRQIAVESADHIAWRLGPAQRGL